MLLSMTAAYIEILPVLTTNQPLPSTHQKSITSNPNPQRINRSPRELHHCPNNPRSSPRFQAECQRMRQDSMLFFYKTFQVKVPCIESPANFQSIESFHTVTRLGFPTALLRSRALRQQVTSAVGRVSFI